MVRVEGTTVRQRHMANQMLANMADVVHRQVQIEEQGGFRVRDRFAGDDLFAVVRPDDGTLDPFPPGILAEQDRGHHAVPIRRDDQW